MLQLGVSEHNLILAFLVEPPSVLYDLHGKCAHSLALPEEGLDSSGSAPGYEFLEA